MKIEKIDSYPKNINPFVIDLDSLGTKLGSNVTLMHMNFPSDKCEQLIVVSTETGERLKISF